MYDTIVLREPLFIKNSTEETAGTVQKKNPMSEDQILIDRVRNNDPGAFNSLILKYQSYVYNFCYKVNRNREDAEDLAQEIFIKAYRGLENFRGDSKFSTWLYRIMINEVSNRKKFKYRRKSLNGFSIDDPLGDSTRKFEIKDTHFDPLNTILNKELVNRVLAEIDKLSSDKRDTLYLREIGGLSYDEIAEVMSCSVGTVKSRINRGRFLLQSKLKEMKDE